MSDTPSVVMTKSDEVNLKQFKKNINRKSAWDIADEAKFNKEYDNWGVHRMDGNGRVVIDTYHFSTEAVAQLAIAHAKSLRV